MADAGRPKYTGSGSGWFQQLDNAALASSVALTVPTEAAHAIITVEGGAVRMRCDGTAPTADIGLYLKDGTILPYSGDLSAVKLIRVANVAGQSVDVQYYTEMVHDR